MREDWENAVTEYKSTGKEPLKEECLIKDGYALLIRRSSTDRNAPIEKIEIWKIREAEFDVQVAVRVEDGLVQEQRIPPQKIVDTLGFKITPKKNKRSTQPEESEQGE